VLSLGLRNVVDAYHIQFMDYAKVKRLEETIANEVDKPQPPQQLRRNMIR